MNRVMPIVVCVLVCVGCGDAAAPDGMMPTELAPVQCGPMEPTKGEHATVVTGFELAQGTDGLDLDGDGVPDNSTGRLGALLNAGLAALTRKAHSPALALESFAMASPCATIAFYVARLALDRDGDGYEANSLPGVDRGGAGDCNDADPTVGPASVENPDNRVDDDCDGYADNTWRGRPIADNRDLDGDGVSVAAGDCDDRADSPAIGPNRTPLAMLRHPAAPGIAAAVDRCDGIDYDCDGIPDSAPECDPLRKGATVPVSAAGMPTARGKATGGRLAAALSAPLPLVLPIGAQRLRFDLELARVSVDVSRTGGMDGMIGGAVSLRSLAAIKIPAAGLVKRGQSWADAIVGGTLAAVLSLPSDHDWVRAAVDVDGDGIEAFRVRDIYADPPRVDECRDGDGSIVASTPGANCLDATDKDGNYRFRDGIAVALRIAAQPMAIGLVQ